MRVKQAVFLVGGKGTRLGTLTQNIPKPLLEIANNMRFIDVLIGEAVRHGFSDIILLAGHFGQQVYDLYHGRVFHHASVRVVIEPEPAGTGGALAFAASLLDPWFLMANGDSLFEINLRRVAAKPTSGTVGRLALRSIANPDRFGTVKLEGSKVTGFFEKCGSNVGPALINGGIYLLSKDILGFVSGACSIEQDIFPKLAASGRLEGEEYKGYFLDIGLTDTYIQACAEIPAKMQRPAVFFDRDGVLNHDEGYTHKVLDLKWCPGAMDGVLAVNEAGYLAIVVTNQAGIARGLYSEEDMHNFHNAMQDQLSEIGAHIDAFYFCPFHKDGTVEAYVHPNHPDRKPNSGMILHATNDWSIKKAGSFLVGDREHDVQAAEAANIPGHLYKGGDIESLIKYLLSSKQNQNWN
jgi:D,D-heptose 1,7-bisphosphate phosphatase